MSITVLLADDHHLMREALCGMLEQQFDFHVVAQAGDGRTAVTQCEELHPDIVVMDIHMPVLNGIDATRAIMASCPETKVVALSMYRDQDQVSEMFRAGAHGYVVKHAALDELHTAIRTVLLGRRYISPDVADIVIDDYVRYLEADHQRPVHSLTDKERQVLQLLSEGHSTREIAEQLFVSVSTIETHRQHIMSKLHVTSIAQLTKCAIRMGLTEV
jgi:two-component system NarL family response regulator